jgi:glycosyltransferase involved in cell wall biosynthesis
MDPSTGGPCQGIRNSIPALTKLGVLNEVVCLDEPSALYIKSDVFTIHAIGSAKNSWGYNVKLYTWLLSNLRYYDVVVVHGLWQYHSYAVWKAIRKLHMQSHINGDLKIPYYYVMPHGMLDPYFQKAAGRKIKAIRNWVYWKLIESKVVNAASGLLFTCEEELRLAREPFKPYTPKKEINVGYGIAQPPASTKNILKAFYDKCPQLEDKSFLLFLSRIHRKKGVLELVQAYEIAKSGASAVERENFPYLVIAGPGLDSEYGKQLTDLVANSSILSNTVYFPGMLNGNAKWGAFYGSQAFILPSHQENFGIAVAEALACGKPVLISDKVNIWREIKEAGGGMIQEDTVTGTTKLISDWCDLSGIKKDIMAVKAKTVYENKFSIHLNAMVFKEVLSAS